MKLFTDDQLAHAEAHLAAGDLEGALPVLEQMAQDAQVFIDETYEPGQDVQWFSFESQFELLTYKRVEHDPRDLRPADAPFARLFDDLGVCQIRLGRMEEAVESLKQAVRWNPMDCDTRLALAGALGETGDYDECLRMTYSVFSRASKSSQLVRAYESFARYFMGDRSFDTAAACVKCGLRLNEGDERLRSLAHELAEDHQCDPAAMTDDLAESLLDSAGIPEGANVEVVLSALLLADIAGERGDLEQRKDMWQIAVDLVGQKRAQALASIVSDLGDDRAGE